MTLGERIRQEREQRGISQAELARRIGVSKNTMNMIEESKIDGPSLLPRAGNCTPTRYEP